MATLTLRAIRDETEYWMVRRYARGDQLAAIVAQNGASAGRIIEHVCGFDRGRATVAVRNWESSQRTETLRQRIADLEADNARLNNNLRQTSAQALRQQQTLEGQLRDTRAQLADTHQQLLRADAASISRAQVNALRDALAQAAEDGGKLIAIEAIKQVLGMDGATA